MDALKASKFPKAIKLYWRLSVNGMNQMKYRKSKKNLKYVYNRNGKKLSKLQKIIKE